VDNQKQWWIHREGGEVEAIEYRTLAEGLRSGQINYLSQVKQGEAPWGEAWLNEKLKGAAKRQQRKAIAAKFAKERKERAKDRKERAPERALEKTKDKEKKDYDRAVKSGSICSACGMMGRPVKVTRGGCAIEIALWLLLLIPGIIYTIWRLTTNYDACAYCGSSDVIPLGTPRGQALFKQFHEQDKG